MPSTPGGAQTPQHTQTNASSDEATPALTRRRLEKLLSYYRPHIPLLVADLACAVLVSATALALPLCANIVTKRLASFPDPAAHGLIYAVGAGMLILLLIQTLSTLFVDYQGHVMGAKMESAIRQEVFDHCQNLSFSFYDRQRVGQLMSRITNDVLAMGELYHHGPEDLAIAVLKFGGAVAILSHLDIVLTSMILAITPFAVASALHFSGRMNRALKFTRRQIGAINERVEDSLAGIRVVKSFTNEDWESRRFAGENAKFLDSRREGYRSEAYFDLGTSAFSQIITVGVIVFGALRVLEAKLSVGDMLTFLLCVGVLIDPVKRLANFVRSWQQGYSGFARVMEILEAAPEIQERPGAVTLGRTQGAIAFRQVGFRYDEQGLQVLKGLNLTIRPGEFVALVGSSGVGKSTLCSLIPRFYEVSEGAVSIDGVDVRDINLNSLRRTIGMVQQDVYLFAGSVRENLLYGRPGAPEADIIAAAKAADAHEFIMALPQGYDSDIGQRGVKLSGGQKQRLTIARAFLKDPAILIFDEATSALDNESEHSVRAALLRLTRNRTTLVIAHRLSTVRNADRILVLTDQGIAEEGAHETLLAADGAYARLYRVQASL